MITSDRENKNSLHSFVASDIRDRETNEITTMPRRIVAAAAIPEEIEGKK